MAANRTAVVISPGQQKTLMKTVKKCVYFFAMARLSHKQESAALGEDVMFGPRDTKKGKYWETIDNLMEQKPVKGLAHPITISQSAAAALSSLLVPIGEAIKRHNKNFLKVFSDEKVEAKDSLELRFVRLLFKISTSMQKLLFEGEHMAYDASFSGMFQQNLSVLVGDKSILGPDGEKVIMAYLDLLRAVGWFAANAAWCLNKSDASFTVNSSELYRIVDDLQVATGTPGSTAELLAFLRERAGEFERAEKTAKAMKAASKAAKGEAGAKAGAKEAKEAKEAKAGAKAGVKTAKAGAKAKGAAKKPAGKKASVKKPAAAKKVAKKTEEAAPEEPAVEAAPEEEVAAEAAAAEEEVAPEAVEAEEEVAPEAVADEEEGAAAEETVAAAKEAVAAAKEAAETKATPAKSKASPTHGGANGISSPQKGGFVSNLVKKTEELTKAPQSGKKVK